MSFNGRKVDVLGGPPKHLTRKVGDHEKTILRILGDELTHVLHEGFGVSEL